MGHCVVAHVCRVGDPTRTAKGRRRTRSSTRSPPLSKGRKFEWLEEQNARLAHWEERYAAKSHCGRCGCSRGVVHTAQRRSPQATARMGVNPTVPASTGGLPFARRGGSPARPEARIGKGPQRADSTQSWPLNSQVRTCTESECPSDSCHSQRVG